MKGIMQGDIVRAREVTSTTPSVIPGTYVEEDLTPLDGQVLVMVIVGAEPLDGPQMDLVQAMNEMGWFRRSQVRGGDV